MTRPLALGCASFLLGLFLSLTCGTPALFGILLALLLLLAVSLLTAAAKRRGLWRPLVALVPALCAVLLTSALLLLPSERIGETGGEGIARFSCTEVYYAADYGAEGAGMLTEWNGRKCRLPVRLSFTGGCDPARGERMTASGTLSFDPSRPAQERLTLTLAQEGITARQEGFALFRRLNEAAASALYASLPEESAGFVSAILLGNRNDVPFGTAASFSNLGISHLLAVSGLHLTLLLSALGWLLDRLSVPMRLRCALCVCAVLFFMGLTGAHPSVLRAGVMQILLHLSALSGREYDPLTSLAGAVTLLCLLDPIALLDPGLQMSAAATLGIVVCTPAMGRTFLRLPAVLRGSLSALLVSAAASVFVSPIAVLTFGSVSLAAVPATLLTALPAEASLLTGMTALLLCRVPFLGSAAGYLCTLVTSWTLRLTSFLSSLGSFQIAGKGWLLVPLLAAPVFLFLLPLLRKKKKKRALFPVFCALLLCLLLPAAALPDRAPARLTFASDGKNDVLLLRAEGQVLLADISDGTSGALSRACGAMTEAEGNACPDAVLLTHYHNRYASSLSRLLDTTRVPLLLLPSPETESEQALASVLSRLAAAVGCRVEFYEGEAEWNGFSLRAEKTYPKRSTHPVLRLLVSRGGKSVLYLSSSAPEVWEEQPPASAALLGAHGPVIHHPASSLPAAPVCASKAVAEQYALPGAAFLGEGETRTFPFD